jgi:hypothetical protein
MRGPPSPDGSGGLRFLWGLPELVPDRALVDPLHERATRPGDMPGVAQADNSMTVVNILT